MLASHGDIVFFKTRPFLDGFLPGSSQLARVLFVLKSTDPDEEHTHRAHQRTPPSDSTSCKSGKELACWDCPTAFPVFMQHPYRAPVCLATASHQEQTRLANMLRAAAQHQSPTLWCEASPDTMAFLDAVSSLKRLRGNCQTEIVEDMCEPMLKSLQHMVIPKLDRTLQEVAAPTWDGFASTGQYFLETYDARMWKCLDGLELSSEGRVWLQETWGVHSGVWRALLLKAQRALYKDLSRDYAMVNSEHAFYIHPDIVFHSILRENLTAYIQSQLMPLPVSSSSSLSETAHNKLLPPTDCMQNFCHTSEGSTSGSETLTPSINSENAFMSPAMPRVTSLLPALLCVLLPGPSRGYFPEERWSPESPLLAPRVVVALVCRNSAHSLPLFLGALERLNYPKDRIALWQRISEGLLCQQTLACKKFHSVTDRLSRCPSVSPLYPTLAFSFHSLFFFHICVLQTRLGQNQ
ncbi:hypothetical protein NQZ68_018343 [Dissostichus eleginoides]|nr:hypothetical protein NQZ68_018343 [Dissostichus eleginoides]